MDEGGLRYRLGASSTPDLPRNERIVRPPADDATNLLSGNFTLK